tara:strand:+ start:759 stop:905 length:147 start_codon:yes stop_codon:yes gene_type:complete
MPNQEINMKIDGVLENNDVLDIEYNDKIVDQLVDEESKKISEERRDSF